MREIGFFQSLFLLFKRILDVFLTSFTKNRVIFTMLKKLAVLCGILKKRLLNYLVNKERYYFEK